MVWHWLKTPFSKAEIPSFEFPFSWDTCAVLYVPFIETLLWNKTKQLTLKEYPPSFLRWNIKPAKQNRSLCGLNVFHYNLSRTWSMIPSSLNAVKDESSALWILHRVQQESLKRKARIVYDEEEDIRPLNTFHLMAEEVSWLQDRLSFFLDLIHCKSH